MVEPPLYQDKKIRIDYLSHSVEDHLLFIKPECGEEIGYIIPRGVLSELARTKRGGIENKLNAMNPLILSEAKQVGIGVDGLHVALSQAFREEEDRFHQYQSNKKD